MANTQTDRIRQRLDVVEARERERGLQCSHNPVVVLAQIKDYRQQIEDAEAVLGAHREMRVSKTTYCPTCNDRDGNPLQPWPCPVVLDAQDRLDRLDTLTALT